MRSGRDLAAALDRHALARDGALLHDERDELARRALLLDPPQRLDAGEVGVERARPAETGGDRVRLGRDVVAVERVADLEPKRVARAEAARRHAAREDRVPERLGVVLRTAELDALLARVAGSRDHDLDAVELAHRVGERRSIGKAESLERARALHGDEAVLVGRVAHLAAARLALLEPGVDGGAIRRVDDEVELPVGEAVRDEVVDDPARLVREERVLRVAVGEPVDVVREHRLQERLRGRAVDVDLAHVRDVERAGVGPDGLVLGDDALVLHGHLVAGERHHARTERDVARIQRRAQERRFHETRL